MVQDLVTNQRKKLGLVQTGMCCNSTHCLYRTLNVFPLEMTEMDSFGLCVRLQSILSSLVVAHACSKVTLKELPDEW